MAARRCRFCPNLARNLRGLATCPTCALARRPKMRRAVERATVPVPLLVLRGDVMSRYEVAAVLGLTAQGVAHIEKQALRRFRENWIALFGEPTAPDAYGDPR